MLMGRQDDDDVCEMATLLLENWADPTLQDENGLTTLHCTVMGKKEKLVLLLLEFEHSNKCDNFSLNQPAGPLCRSCRSAGWSAGHVFPPFLYFSLVFIGLY